MNRNYKYWFNLIAILIGFYGNWYFNLMTKLIEVRNNLGSQFIWIVSCISLFMFCVEFANPKRRF